MLLAAGAGSRFGGGKLLHPLANGTPIGVASARNLLSVVPEVVAVVRPGDEAIAVLLEQAGCRVSVCASAERGMGASLAHGISLCSDASGWIVALADMPYISSAAISLVVGSLVAGAQMAAPFYRGERGHPVGFGRDFRDQLLALDGDIGARDLIKRHAAEIVKLDCDDRGVLFDIDRRDDLSDPHTPQL